jgi:UDP-glucose 4-epimerase
MLMRSVGVAHPDWRLITLRYFNPCGSHPTGLIGDEPSVFPNNLFPYIIEVILGNKPKLFVYGTDYDTPDGTGIRDYLHICDLSKGHIAALKKLPQLTERNYEKYNLGTGKGLSVMDIIHGFEQVLARKLPYELAGRRPGDVTVLVANVEKAHKELQWSAQKTLADMCRDSVNYARKHGKV